MTGVVILSLQYTLFFLDLIFQAKLLYKCIFPLRVNYEEAAERPQDTKDDISAKLHKSISDKLKIFLKQKNQEHRIPDIEHFTYKTAGTWIKN